MRGILINSSTRKVSYVHIGNHYTEISKAIGCRVFTSGSDIGNNSLYVDDEGLLLQDNNFFYLPDQEQPFAGNGLILGLNLDTGESCDTDLTVDVVDEVIRFLDMWDIQMRYRG